MEECPLRYLRSIGALAAACLICSSCTDKVTLSSEDLSLEYPCDDIPALVRDARSAELIRFAASDLIGVAAREGKSSWGRRLESFLGQQDVRGLERTVVMFMCETGVRPGFNDIAHFPDSGSVAPNFALPVAFSPIGNGQGIVSLEAHRGQIVLLDFWASWCVPCLAKQPHVGQLAQRFGPRGLRVYGVLVDDQVSHAERWVRQHGRFTYPFLQDQDDRMSADFMVAGIPRMFLIGRSGEVLGHCFGCASGTMAPDQLSAWLEELLPEPG
jgi:thiol-disulfide isomerase/thioredoxin